MARNYHAHHRTKTKENPHRRRRAGEHLIRRCGPILNPFRRDLVPGLFWPEDWKVPVEVEHFLRLVVVYRPYPDLSYAARPNLGLPG